MKRTLTVVLLLVLAACSTKQTPSNNSQPAAGNQPSQPSQQPSPMQGDLREGEASGTIIDEGQPVTLKYAYAGNGEMFHEDALIILLTEAPVPPEELSKAFEEYGTFPKSTRGLQYKVGKGFWVMYHPSGFQTSGINTLKDYSVENGVVKGRDEDSTSFDGKEYKRSVSFVARVPDKKK